MSISVSEAFGKVIQPEWLTKKEEDFETVSHYFHSQEHCPSSVLLSEPLGSYISSYDAQKILSKGLRKKSWIKAYYTNKELLREKYILDFVDLIVASIDENFNSSIIEDAVYLFKLNLPNFLASFKENYFTSNLVAMYFFALLDHRLQQVGGKLTAKDIEIIYSLPKITPNAFSFYNIKKIQNDLYSRGILKRKRRTDFYEPLRARIKDILGILVKNFPELGKKFDDLEQIVFDLINMRKVPGTNYKDAAVIMIMSVATNLFELKYRHDFWLILSKEYTFEKEKMIKSVYRFRSRLKGVELNKLILKSYVPKAIEKKEEREKKATSYFEIKKAIYLFSDKIMDKFPRLEKDLLLVEQQAYRLIDKNIHENLDVNKYNLPVLLFQSLIPKLDIAEYEKKRLQDFLKQFMKTDEQILNRLKKRIELKEYSNRKKKMIKVGEFE
ncbi:MAG: hypothetical protein K9W46_00570 [Candidatus Heimdallarchaeum endolithica]|uniref:Uncharacterized protein n=1 Tax=Candidatus Heimdallarchaeum endolithica TaxID=2876572 RepID=A0A9Y1FNF3_9ARCH|nr:MAG: hypothetical protein K9W46_00570 [Candidatus Heimdallarchaeum endolithica]